jgi:EAL domain-containing protein (putative c-di-GMP-specific phosphodiesterase class I)
VTNPDGTITSVGPSIPTVEKMGFIDLIDSVALKLAIEELEHDPDVHLSVNTSSITLQQPQWVEMAAALLQDRNVASRLILEVTETFEYHQLAPLTKALETLRALGCSIALDDFGAGYTSLSHIRMLPIDMIKIDGSFVRDMLYRPDHYAFVQTLIELGQRLGLKTIAEFVENIPIAKAATSLQVDYMQGHHFACATRNRPWLGRS